MGCYQSAILSSDDGEIKRARKHLSPQQIHTKNKMLIASIDRIIELSCEEEVSSFVEEDGRKKSRFLELKQDVYSQANMSIKLDQENAYSQEALTPFRTKNKDKKENQLSRIRQITKQANISQKSFKDISNMPAASVNTTANISTNSNTNLKQKTFSLQHFAKIHPSSSYLQSSNSFVTQLTKLKEYECNSTYVVADPRTFTHTERQHIQGLFDDIGLMMAAPEENAMNMKKKKKEGNINQEKCPIDDHQQINDIWLDNQQEQINENKIKCASSKKFLHKKGSQQSKQCQRANVGSFQAEQIFEHPTYNMQSFSADDEEDYTQCNLSNPTRFLHESLVSEGICIEKNQFYFCDQYNRVNLRPQQQNCEKQSIVQNNHYHQQSQQLLQWTQVNRKSYKIEPQLIENIARKKGNHFIILSCVMQAIYLTENRKQEGFKLISYKSEPNQQQSSLFIKDQQNNKSSTLTHNNGIRVFVNGIKRLFPIPQIDESFLQQNICEMYQKLFFGCSNLQVQQINNAQLHDKQLQKIPSACQLVYSLTGWMPEEIIMHDIGNTDGILQRIQNNFRQGNTIITFTLKLISRKDIQRKLTRTNGKQCCVALKRIDLQNKEIYACLVDEQSKQFFKNHVVISKRVKQNCVRTEISMKWNQFIKQIYSINVNWNPLIYDFKWKSQGNILRSNKSLLSTSDSAKLKLSNSLSRLEELDPTNISSRSAQYLIKIPPNQVDIQVRVFLEKHCPLGYLKDQQKHSQLIMELYDSTFTPGGRINSFKDSIRVLQKNNTGQNISDTSIRKTADSSVFNSKFKKSQTFSDVLIFQSSCQKNQYVLVIREKPEISYSGTSMSGSKDQQQSISMSDKNNNFQTEPTKQVSKLQNHHFYHQFSISAFSFYQISITELAQERIVAQKQIDTFLRHSHTGYSINSPYFLENLCLSIDISKQNKALRNRQCEKQLYLKIFVRHQPNQFSEETQSHHFQINLIQNKQNRSNITQLDLENFLNEIKGSDEIQKEGYYDCQVPLMWQELGNIYDSTTNNNVSLFCLITSHTKSKGQMKIVTQVVEKIKRKSLMFPDKLQNYKNENTLNIKIDCKEVVPLCQPTYKKAIKWSSTNTGPRKRLKSNTNSNFQPYSAFQQFFKNPYVDFVIKQNKKHQFRVKSTSYQSLFNRTQGQVGKSQLDPPTLSMSIFRVGIGSDLHSIINFQSQKNTLKRKIATSSIYRQKSILPATKTKKNIPSQEKTFQIVSDDAFYVPFGFGFWTPIMQLQEGQYRFVFPKMENQAQEGCFQVYEL